MLISRSHVERRKFPVTADRDVRHPDGAMRRPRRKGLKAVLPVEDIGSFASLLNAFDRPEVAPDQHRTDPEK